jgi:hypothetical protein
MKIIGAAIAALCLALPAMAAGEDHARAVDHITCADGTVLTPPFSSPVCSGHGAVASVTCVGGATLTAPLDGKRCPAPSDTTSSDDAKGSDDAPDAADGPGKAQGLGRGHGADKLDVRFAAGFLNRVWRISGEANGFADGVLDFTAARFRALPTRWSHQDDAIVGIDSRVLVGARTRVYDADHHRLAAGDVADALDAAADVVVVGKVVPKAKWQQDEDGTPVPTLRAKQVLISD